MPAGTVVVFVFVVAGAAAVVARARLETGPYT
jgi:hypothetical protein